MQQFAWIVISSAILIAGCGSAASPSPGGADASSDTGPVGVTATGIAAPSQFTCTSASKNAAGFSWAASPTAGVVGYVVERAALTGDFAAQPAVDAKTLSFADLTVAQVETYRYRVRAKVGDKLGDSSNEVTVGAMPAGFRTFVGSSIPEHSLDLALDGNGDPALLFDKDKTLLFSAWDRKQANWKVPTVVTPSFLDGDSGSNVATLAFDHAGSSGTFAVIWASADGQEIDWALSSDAGKTWQQDTIAVAPVNTSFSQPTLALGNGKAHIAWLQDGARLFYATGTLSTPPKNWTADKEAPPAVKADKLLPFAPAIALDAAQVPAIAYFSHGTDDGVIATFWRPGDASARSIMNSEGFPDPQASLSIAFKGSAPRAAITLHKSAATVAPVWFVTSSDGNSWGVPLALPVDGAAANHRFTRLVTTSKDASAITYESGASDGGKGKCGDPKLALSTDGVTWTTCSPDAEHSRSDVALASRIALGVDGKRWLAWHNATDSSLMVWREP